MVTQILIRNDEINKNLEEIAKEISIPKSKYEEAENHYKAVGEWLANVNSELAKYNPIIYAQGSFALGTAIKPINKEEYDVDAVCKLELSTSNTTQADLKKIVGDRLMKNDRYKPMLEEKRRCWTLNYSDSSKFHLDILPAIPDNSISFDTNTYRNYISGELICITDNKKEDYYKFSSDWLKSNPKGYAEWFKKRMFLTNQQNRVINCCESVDDLPLFQQTTTLQKVIQLLKYHRNLKYLQNEHKPISIIITTLAAKAYNGEDNIYDAMKNIIANMSQYIEIRGNEYWIENPINSDENFADKWNKEPIKAIIFSEWLSGLNSIFQDLLSENTDFSEVLNEAYGLSNNLDETQIKRKVRYISDPVRKSVFDVGYRQALKWPILKKCSVAVHASFRKPHSTQTSTYYSDGPALPKNGTLQFNVKLTTPIQGPYKVMLQVVNTGKEATEANNLRGKFFEYFYLESNHHKEHTQYQGKHMIQASIIQNGVCIGQSEEFIVNIQ